jgi:uncharacterized protein (TIGR02145 family)
MKKVYTIGLIIIAMIISQQAFPQKENSKNPLAEEQLIEVSEGYCFVSSRLIPENPDMLEVVQEILSDLQYVRNSDGAMLRKIGPNWINGIGDWVGIEGYLIKTDVAGQFTIEGTLIPQDTPIELSTGFQFVSYLPANEIDALEAFNSIIGDNLVYIRNSEGNMLRKIGPNWVNGIGDCMPGEGYLIKILADDVLIYPGSSPFTCGDPFTDPRDGQTYNTVLIGDQCWMAENLNIGEMINVSQDQADNGVFEKYCYANDEANCEERGGLYQWWEFMQYTTTQGVQGICPEGWHVPTDDEFKILEGTVDSQYPVGDPIWNNTGWRGFDVGLKLKSTTGWNAGGNGTDDFGFTGLPGGYSDYKDDFENWGNIAGFWTSTENNIDNSFYRVLFEGNDGAYRKNFGNDYGFSVRCLKD